MTSEEWQVRSKKNFYMVIASDRRERGNLVFDSEIVEPVPSQVLSKKAQPQKDEIASPLLDGGLAMTGEESYSLQ